MNRTNLAIMTTLLLSAFIPHHCGSMTPMDQSFESASGRYRFKYPSTWTLTKISVDQRSEGVLLDISDSGKPTAGISVQRYVIPYKKQGIGIWERGADYLNTLRNETDRMNRWLSKSPSVPQWKITQAANLPESAKKWTSIEILKDNAKSTVVVIERKNDFLAITYQGAHNPYDNHKTAFIEFLKNFNPR